MFYALRGRVTAARSLTCLSKEVEGYLSLFEPKAQPPQISNTTNKAEFGEAMPEPELGPLVGRMLAREPINATGEFHIRIDGRQHPYQGKELMVVLQIQRLEGQDLRERAYKTLFCILGPWQAKWSQEGRHMLAEAQFHLPIPYLGKIREQLGVWSLLVQADGLAEAKLTLKGNPTDSELLSLEEGHQATLAQIERPNAETVMQDLLINGQSAEESGWVLEQMEVNDVQRSIDIRLKNNNSQ